MLKEKVAEIIASNTPVMFGKNLSWEGQASLILNLFKAEIDKLTVYIEQVTTENNGTHEGDVLIDPSRLAALDYWFNELKKQLKR